MKAHDPGEGRTDVRSLARRGEPEVEGGPRSSGGRRPPVGGRLSHGELLELQRVIGNRAVHRLVTASGQTSHRAAAVLTVSSASSGATRLLQRVKEYTHIAIGKLEVALTSCAARSTRRGFRPPRTAASSSPKAARSYVIINKILKPAELRNSHREKQWHVSAVPRERVIQVTPHNRPVGMAARGK